MISVNNMEFNYPTFCISLINNNIVFTTKKTGSRFFEELSCDNTNDNLIKTINLKLFSKKDVTNLDLDFVFGEYYFTENYGSFIDSYYIFKQLGIQKWDELFSEKVSKDYKFIFIVRNPIDRFYTGFFEKIDSIIGELEKDSYGIFLKNIIIKKYFKLSTFKLNELTQDKIDFILNEFAVSVDSKIFNDEHLTFWNTFLLQFVNNNKLQNKIEIIDLNDSQKMNIFNKSDQPSNKPWLTEWMNNSNNSKYIDEMISNLKPYLDIEMDSYNKLLNLQKM